MNFVFFFADQFRAESAACYGNPVLPTPNLDSFAAGGTRFDQCHVQASLCSPSRCSLMTGWYPHVAGHRSLLHLLQAHEPSLFRTLREGGYQVEVYGKNDVFSREHLPLAVDRWEHPAGTAKGRPLCGPDDPRFWTFLRGPIDGGPESTGDFACIRKGIDFLHSPRSRKKPFCLFLPLLYPHPAYNAPPEFHDLIDPAAIPPLRPVMPHEGMPSFHRLIRHYRRLDKLDDSVIRKVHAVYLGMCAYVDWMFGELLHALEESGHSGDTTVIFASDHGDFAGDYGLVEKCHVAFNDVMTRVPLIIRTPSGPAGHVVREPVELMDVMPTMLELAGLRPAHTHFARSLVPQIMGNAGDADRAVFAECGFGDWERHCFEGSDPADWTWDPSCVYYPQTRQYHEEPASISRTVMLRTDREKLILRPDDVSELYDLQADPRETRNLYHEESSNATRIRLERRLLEWLIRTSDVTPHQPDGRGWPPMPDHQLS